MTTNKFYRFVAVPFSTLLLLISVTSARASETTIRSPEQFSKLRGNLYNGLNNTSFLSNLTKSDSTDVVASNGIWTRSRPQWNVDYPFQYIPSNIEYPYQNIVVTAGSVTIADRSKIFASTAFGNSWLDITPVGFSSQIAPHLAIGANVYVKGNNSIWKSTGGSSWFRIPYNTINFGDLQGMHTIRINGTTALFISSFFGVYYTTDDGVSWTRFTNGLPLGSNGNLSRCFNFQSTSITATSNQYLYINCGGTIYRSFNANGGWMPMNTNGLPTGRLVKNIFPARDGSARLYATLGGFNCGIYRNDTNSEGTWAPACNVDLFGTQLSGVNSLVSDLFNSNIAYVNTDHTVFKTTNGGQTWAPFGMGLPNNISNQYLHTLAIDNNGLLAPRPTLYVSDYAGGVWTLNDTPNAGCTYNVTPVSPLIISAAGHYHPVTVTTQQGCVWAGTYSGTNNWLSVIEGAGAGSGNFIFRTTENNTNAARTDTIKVVGQTLTVKQEPHGVCNIPPVNISFGQTINESISTYECGSSFIYDSYTFSGSTGQQIAISMNSTEFYTVLQLTDSNGQLIGFNASEFPNKNSRIPTTGFIQLPSTGTFTIRAGSHLFEASYGNYTLNLMTNNPQNRTKFDFDGDGRADQAVFRTSDRVWYLLRSSSGFTAAQFGVSTDKITPADFDGDSKTDIAVFRDGIWYWLNSSNGAFNSVQFGQAGDIPVPADYTGDGRAELAVYRGGIWHTLNLANGGFQGVQFGISTDKPVPADFDADGKTDFAVYRNGVWYMLRSTAGFTAVQFGISSDKPTVGDYDGDGKADQAVYRSGVWYILGSTQGFYGFQFGIASDVPIAADYDGDGKTDVAVFRDGVWYMQHSQQGFGTVQFGTTNDRPIPAVFVP